MSKFMLLNSEMFEEPLRDFDTAINEALVKMLANKAEDCSITLKLDISLTNMKDLSMKANASYTVPTKEKYENKLLAGQFFLGTGPNGVEILDNSDQERLPEFGGKAW